MYRIIKKHRIFLAVSLLVEILTASVFVILSFRLSDSSWILPAFIGVFFFFAITAALINFVFNMLIKGRKGKTELTSADIVGNDMDEAYNFGEVGLAVCDSNDVVIWVNNFLQTRIPNLVDNNIYNKLKGLDPTQEEKSWKRVMGDDSSHIFDVELLEEARLFVFKETTVETNLQDMQKRNDPVIGYVSIDNYYDIQQSFGDEIRFTGEVTKCRQIITDYFAQKEALLRQVQPDTYFVILTKEKYELMLDDKFALVDSVKRGTDGFTISIGLSCDFHDYIRLSERASTALDVALSRGGDQVVVSPFGHSLLFFGGRSEMAPSKNKVKVRSFATAFVSTLSDKKYEKVLVMGHINADLDAIGAEVAVYAMCRKIGVNCRLCFDEQLVDNTCRRAIDTMYDSEEKKSVFISMEDCAEYLDDDTLLVLVDHNSFNLSMFKELASTAKNVAIVDHHRPSEKKVRNPVFDYVDPSASSTSEILTFFILYSDLDYEISSRQATLLLSGISLDTRFFKEKTSAFTFEAASQLKTFKADTAKVDDLLKEDLDDYNRKNLITRNVEVPTTDVLLAAGPDDTYFMDATLAIAANELSALRGIKCAMAVGRVDSHTIKVSCRSNGEVNCQFLMEKLKGGGHLTMAATKFTDISIKEAKQKIRDMLTDYFEDALIKKGS